MPTRERLPERADLIEAPAPGLGPLRVLDRAAVVEDRDSAETLSFGGTIGGEARGGSGLSSEGCREGFEDTLEGASRLVDGVSVPVKTLGRVDSVPLLVCLPGGGLGGPALSGASPGWCRRLLLCGTGGGFAGEGSSAAGGS